MKTEPAPGKNFNNLAKLIDVFNSKLDKISINSAVRWSNSSWSVPAATRVDFEINFFVKGTAELKIREESFHTSPGEIYYSDNSQGTFCNTGSFAADFFSFSVKDHEGGNHGLYMELQKCFKSLPVKFDIRKKDYLDGLLKDMIREINIKEPGYELKLKLLAVQVFIETMRSESIASRNASTYPYLKYSAMVSEIIEYLSENLQSSICLSDLGRKYNLAPGYLNRVFKAVTGYPVLQYQQNLRIEKAKRLLSSSPMTLLDIALELGFESSQYLNRLFKKWTGLTPGDYRKMVPSVTAAAQSSG